MGVWGEDPLVARDDELAEAAPERSVTWMQGMGAAGADGFDSGTEPPRALFREHRELQSQFMYENRNNWQSWYMADAFDRQQPVWLSAEEANRTYGIEGALDFAPDHPDGVSEEYAASLYEVRARMVARADEVARMPHVLPFHLDSMLAALAGGFVNPVNLVTVLPFGRWGALRTAMPRLAAAEQSANFAVRFGGRAAFGAIEGAGAMAAIDPFYQWARTRGGQDWHLTDSLAQLALGAVMGGTMGAVFGERTLPREDYRAPAAVDALDPVTREAAASAALVQAADGRPIDVRPIMAEGRMRAEAELNQSPTDLRYRPIKEAEVFSPSGEQLSARYAVVEIGDLVTSNTDGLAVNPEYPQLLQPRDRTRAASETQISSFGAPFQPERWGESPQADAGAPVVGSDRVVESGNGRTIFLRRAYRAGDPRAETYRAWLKREGYPIEGLKQPMLVRVVDAGRGAEARMRFAQDANKPGAATMSASELAFADAKRLSASVLDEHKGGAASAEGNAPFSRAALSALTSEAERGALIDATGLLSKSGETRLEAALMARAYDDAALVSMRFEAIDEDFKTIGGALSDAAPAMARVAMGVDAGQIVRDFDVRAALSAAVALLRQAKKDGKSVKAFLSELHAQGDMFGGGLSARTVDMLALLTEDGVRVRPRAKIAASLDAFAHVAEISPAPVLFEEAKFGYSSGFKAAAYKAGEPGLRARDAGGADGGGRGQIVDGAGAEERARTGRAQITEALQQDFTAAGLAPEQAAAAARVQANVITNLAAHYGEDPFAAFETMRPRIQRSDNAQRAALEQRIVEGEALGQGAKGAEIRERLADSDRLIERAKEMSQAFAAAAECAATHGLGAAATAGLGEMVAGNLLGASVAGVAGAVGANEQGRATRKAEFDRLEGERVASEARAAEQEVRRAYQAAIASAIETRRPDQLPEMSEALAAFAAAHPSGPTPRGAEREALSGYVDDVTTWAADMTGADRDYLRRMFRHESFDNPAAVNVDTNATGLSQFIASTWKVMLARHGESYGVDAPDDVAGRDALRLDPRLNAVMGGELANENARRLRDDLGVAPTIAEVYLYHMMGPRWGLALIRGATETPNEPAAPRFPAAADKNRSVFYVDSDLNRPRTFLEVYDLQARNFVEQGSSRPYEFGEAAQ